MNDESLKLLEKLANKLGTTSEYLWTVLVKQAPVAAVNEIIFTVFTVVLGIVLFNLNKKFMNDNNEVSYDNLDGVLIVPMVVGTGLFVIFAIGVMFGSIPTIISGFINPEFWALNYVLENIK